MIKVREHMITMLEAHKRKVVCCDLIDWGFSESKAYKRALGMHAAKLPHIMFRGFGIPEYGISEMEKAWKSLSPDIWEWAEKVAMELYALEFSIKPEDFKPFGILTESHIDEHN